MSAHLDPYETLGLDRECTKAEVRAAFRAKARTLHPDVGGGAVAFAEAKLAHDILSDPARRARYDTTGATEAGGSAQNDVARGLDVLAQAFNQVFDTALKQNANPEQILFVQSMESWLSANLQRNQHELAELKRQIALREKLAKRFRLKRKKGQNFMRRMISEQAAALRGRTVPLDENIVSIKAAMKLLADQSFAAEQAMQMPMGGFFIRQNAPSTSGTGFR